MYHEYRKLSAVNLKLKCKEYGLCFKGTKQDMITRLETYDYNLQKHWLPIIKEVDKKVEVIEDIISNVNLDNVEWVFLKKQTFQDMININDINMLKKYSLDHSKLMKCVKCVNEMNMYNIYINKHMMHFLILNNIQVPDAIRYRIKNILYKTLNKKDKSIYFKDNTSDGSSANVCEIPFVPKTEIIPQNARIKTNLYEYQLKTVQWMINVEKKIDVEFKFKCKYLIDEHHKYIDISKYAGENTYLCNTKFVYTLPDPIMKNETFTTTGGILANNVGLGKTLCCLELIIDNPSSIDTIFTRIDLNTTNHYECRATLIICPNHLVQQWIDESLKHIFPKLRICVLAVKRDYDNVSYEDILTSDIVITNFFFLQNNHYIQKMCLKKIQELDNPLKQISPYLLHFKWHRLIIDECHELNFKLGNNNKFTKTIKHINEIQANYRWYVSGTPFPNQKNSMENICKFLNIHFSNDDDIEYYYDSIIENLYIRYDSNTIEEQLNIPDIIYETHMIEFNDIERQTYNYSINSGKPIERILKLCCHMQVDDDIREISNGCKSLKEIKDKLLSYKEKKLEECKKIINKKKIELEKETDSHKKGGLKNSINVLEKKVNETISFIKFFKSNIDKKLQGCNDACVICLDDIPKNNMGLLDCGHIFCYTCVYSVCEKSRKCPLCRYQVNTIKEIHKVSQTEQKKIYTKIQHEELISTYGTKIGNIIIYLQKLKKNNPNYKAIIFSQWNSMLELVSIALNDNNIKNLFCVGNIFSKTNTINDFKSDTDVNVIMLSLENSASGTNLTEASHIIFIDTIDGADKESIIAKENQAIGRAHRIGQNKQIVVAKFIIKNTIEEEIFNKMFGNQSQT